MKNKWINKLKKWLATTMMISMLFTAARVNYSYGVSCASIEENEVGHLI